MAIYQILWVIFSLPFANAVEWFQRRNTHVLKEIDYTKIQRFMLNMSTNRRLANILENICIPRVPDTPGNKKVRKYIFDNMKQLKWNVDLHTFNDKTPVGKKMFVNIIATQNPSARRRLVFACHYDSKKFDTFIFVGATDSAASCAMMIDLAWNLDWVFKKNESKSDELTLQFIFFDGEEAFQLWSARDSLYGSRRLAEDWGKQLYPPGNTNKTTQLNRIDVFVLLDLIGAKNPLFANYFKETSHLFKSLATIERKLIEMSLLFHRNDASHDYFDVTEVFHGGIEDDHIPFMKRGVPIIHLIVHPFPAEWHTEKDSLDIVDYRDMRNLIKILSVFVISYLNLSVTCNNKVCH